MLIDRATMLDFKRGVELTLQTVSEANADAHGWAAELERFSSFALLQWREAGSPDAFKAHYGGGFILVKSTRGE